MNSSEPDSTTSQVSPGSKSTSSPRAKGFKFEPEYAVENGVAHTFNGTLYVPTPEEFERIEKDQTRRETEKQLSREMTGAVNAMNPVPMVVRPFPEKWQTKRVKMSAKDLIRLNAGKSNA